MLEGKENPKYIDNRPEFRRRLAADLQMLPGAIADAVTEATAIILDRGGDEAAALKDKYPDLLCPWCGKLHYRAECQAQSAEYLANNKREVSKPIQKHAIAPEGLNPFEIFYDAGSIGLISELERLSFDELEAVRIRFTAVKREYNIVTLIALIVQDVKNRCHRGAAFGDVKIPD